MPSDRFIDYSGWFELPSSIVWARESDNGLARHLRQSIHGGAGVIMYHRDSGEQSEDQVLGADHAIRLFRPHQRC